MEKCYEAKLVLIPHLGEEGDDGIDGEDCEEASTGRH